MRQDVPPPPRTLASAFSLVELSIVLVILGLLVGGVLAGKSLIRAAELRSVTTERETYLIAVKSFRDKYFMLPGDMNNATQFWGARAAPSTGAACQGIKSLSTSTAITTCDGDGNGKIDYGTIQEPLHLWQHLANAGLIAGKVFIGDTDDNGCIDWTDLGYAPSCAKARVGDFWNINHRTLPYSVSVGFLIEYGNAMQIGSGNSSTIWRMTGAEALNIDKKIDDGKPARGQVVSNGVLSRCTTTNLNTNLDADYLTDTSNAFANRRLCSVSFVRQF